MIKINRENIIPDPLKKNPLTSKSYQEPDVQLALTRMQFNKCAYCEKSLGQEKQIDHFRPQEEFVIGYDDKGKKIYDWNRANRWENLLYACKDCNGAKTKNPPFDLVTGERLIIDPSADDIDPEEYIDFVITEHLTSRVNVIVTNKNNKKLGRDTVDKLRLARKRHTGDLKQFCLELYIHFAKLLLHLKNGRDINEKECQDKLSYIKRSMDPRQPYTAFA
ncbi:MAG: HNH endonuclease, partial [Nitrospirota bacterium]|nr:HNH endonuclease [Nitrospirota bacterium]